jgi:hypothetical protein
MRWVSVSNILILALMLVPHPSGIRNEQFISKNQTAQEITNIERNWIMNIILVDYDMQLINDTILLASLPTSYLQALIIYWPS